MPKFNLITENQSKNIMLFFCQKIMHFFLHTHLEELKRERKNTRKKCFLGQIFVVLVNEAVLFLYTQLE